MTDASAQGQANDAMVRVENNTGPDPDRFDKLHVEVVPAEKISGKWPKPTRDQAEGIANFIIEMLNGQHAFHPYHTEVAQEAFRNIARAAGVRQVTS